MKKVKENGLHIISSKKFEKEFHKESIVFALVAKKIVENSSNQPSKEINAVLNEFQDIFPSKLHNVLSLIRDIQHTINYL